MRKSLLYSILFTVLSYTGMVCSSYSQAIAGGVWNSYFYCNGNLSSVGKNDVGQLGTGSIAALDSVGSTIPGPTNVISMSGSYHVMFVAGDSTLWSAGQNYGGECGNGNNSNVFTAVQIAGMTGVKKVACGESHSLILKGDGTVWACGVTTNGEFGNGMTSDSNVPVQCTISNVIDIAVGSYHSVFLKADGTVWTCGYNLYGQLGLGFSNTSPNPLPVQVDTITNGVAVTAGDQGTMVVTADGSVWAFGYNGGAGDKFSLGGTNPGSTPQKSTLISNVVDAVCSRYHSIFIKDDGTAWASGSNYYGQLGLGNTVDHDTAVQVPGLSNIVDEAVGYQHSIFLKGDGTVWVAGANGYGQLGTGTTQKELAVVQIGLCSASGIEENFDADIIVYPNPSTGIFTIQSSEIISKVEIINVVGVTVSTHNVQTDKVNIDLINQPQGVYFYRVYNGKKVLGSGKLIVHW